uniref:AAA ATPase domain protein n=1 Tax=Mimivirus LCMiAC01 TaxID=2506608 RepID=A0A481Z0T4_9VIRU|nr:MAG: AAA ATPase domain protein [Mimivirus LCMiAC01]
MATFKPQVGIRANLWLNIKKSNIKLLFMEYFVLWVATCIINSISKKMMLDLIDINIDRYRAIKIVATMGLLRIMNQWIRSVSSIIQYKKIPAKFNTSAKSYYWGLMATADITWLRSKDFNNIIHSIDGGITSMNIILKTGLSFADPLSRCIVTLWILYNKIGYITVYIFIIFIVLFVAGMILVKRSYLSGKLSSKRIKPIYLYINSIKQTFFTEMLNGRGSIVSKAIVKKSEMINKIQQSNSNRNMLEYNCFNSCHTFMVTLFVISIIWMGLNDIKLVAILYNTINGACYTVWGVFHKMRNIIVQVSKWNGLEEILKEYDGAHDVEKVSLTSLTDLDSVFPKKFTEARIIGKSGSGKTSFMLQLLCKAFKQNKVSWLYLDQKMQILESEIITIRQFMTEYLPDGDVADSVLCETAKILQIENIINSETLGESFVKPSGGEVKRIMIIRAILPILTNCTKVQYIFADEMTAGLDEESWTLVRSLFDEIQKKYNIRVVSIDHHDFETDIKISVKIMKQEGDKEKNKKEDKDAKGTNKSAPTPPFYDLRFWFFTNLFYWKVPVDESKNKKRKCAPQVIAQLVE